MRLHLLRRPGPDPGASNGASAPWKSPFASRTWSHWMPARWPAWRMGVSTTDGRKARAEACRRS